jgi:protocatechuate 3,4-dioxygenase beta subunit
MLLAQQGTTVEVQSANAAGATNSLNLAVISRSNGQAVAGAKVQLIAEGARPHVVRYWTTDRTGGTTLEISNAAGNEVKLWILADDYVPNETVVQRDAGGLFPARHSVRMEEAVRVGGTVLDETGKPISGVEVFVGVEKKQDAKSDLFARPGHEGFHYEKTDEQGRWTCSHAPKQLQTARFRLMHSRYVTVEIAPDPQERAFGTDANVSPADLLAARASVFMSHGVTLNGLVVDANGEPIEGAEVTGPDYPVWTPADGRFSFRNCRAGPVIFLVQAGGFAPQRKQLVSGETNEARIQLDAGNSLKLRVQDSKGRPIPGSQIAVERWQGQPIDEWQWETDNQGKFVWGSAPPDEVLYRVAHAGYETLRGQILKADGQEHVVVLHKHLQISGRVLDAETQAPISAFRVIPGQLHVNHFDWSPTNTVNGEMGSYVATLAKQTNPHPHVLQVQADGYYPEISRTFQDAEEDVVFDFRLKRGESLTGRVELLDGKPAVKAQVALCTQDTEIGLSESGFLPSSLGNTAEANDRGEFMFQPRSGMRWIAAANAQGYAEMPVDAFKQSQTISLQPWGRIAGSLWRGNVLATNELLQLVRIGSLCPQFHANQFTRLTDAEGRFTFEQVPAGEHLIGRLIQNQFSHGQVVKVAPGKTTEVALGSGGRAFSGQMASADGRELDWEGFNHPAFLRAALPPLSTPQLADAMATNDWLRAYWDTPEGRTRQVSNVVYVLQFKSNNLFQVENVRPGSYECEIHYHQPGSAADEPDKCLGILRKQVEIPSVNTGQPDLSVDLGRLVISLKSPAR